MFFPDEPVPVEVVRELASLLAANSLSELTLESKADENALRLSLERETRIYAAAPISVEAVAVTPTSEAAEPAVSEATAGATAPLSDEAREIGAPCVGVYRAPKKPVQTGDRVRGGQVIAIVESLRVPNEVLAPFDAKVIDIPVIEGEGVEWGQTLLVLEPAS